MRRLVYWLTGFALAVLVFHLPLYFLVDPHRMRWLWRIDEMAGLAWLFVVTLLPFLVLRAALYMVEAHENRR